MVSCFLNLSFPPNLSFLNMWRMDLLLLFSFPNSGLQLWCVFLSSQRNLDPPGPPIFPVFTHSEPSCEISTCEQLHCQQKPTNVSSFQSVRPPSLHVLPSFSCFSYIHVGTVIHKPNSAWTLSNCLTWWAVSTVAPQLFMVMSQCIWKKIQKNKRPWDLPELWVVLSLRIVVF